MISKAMILGAAAAVVATGTGYFIATGGTSECNGGCPIRAMLNTKPSQEAAKEESGGCCGLPNLSCCESGVSKTSKLASAPKPTPVDSPTLAACVGGPAYATHPQPVTCCADE